MFKSMRVRLTLSFLVLIAVFGWFITRSISHSDELMKVYSHEGQQHHIRLALTTFMAILFPCLAIGAWVIVGRTLKPLRALSKQAENSTAVRLTSPSSDAEMVELVGTINHLFDRIEASAELKAKFFAATSHELRTPLQVLNGYLENSLSQPRSEDEYRQALVEAQKQTQRLTILTNDVLLLHQIQTQPPSTDEEASISDSLQLILDELQPLFETRALVVVTEIAAGIKVSGRQSYADVCFRNLLENAARYTPEGGQVQVTLVATQLTVTNGAALPESTNLQDFLEPFSTSKGLSHGATGNGLGLAICGSAAKANGWKVTIQSEKNQVLATVVFPR